MNAIQQFTTETFAISTAKSKIILPPILPSILEKRKKPKKSPSDSVIPPNFEIMIKQSINKERLKDLLLNY